MGYSTPQVLAGLLGPLLLATTLSARTMYATDTFEIVVRSDKQIVGRNIIKVLPSGTAIEVRDMDDAWAAVRLEDGRTGYVEKRQLIDREPYKVTAERLQLEVGQQRERLATLTQQLTTLRDEHQRLQKSSGLSEARLQDISQKYEQLRQEATTTQFLETKEKYADLQRAHAEAQQQLGTLNNAYAALKNSTRLTWFLSGAGVVLVGWLMGMTSERWRGRRRRQGGYSYHLPS
ncbi:MAG TPA: TIGR04211 family SH3 domain-containing protein [Candidatus Tectomicrobia bacterium]